jgi:arylsulfatase A-like enzyme/cytochrome c-type biogenesis protein CcmH/NrfG
LSRSARHTFILVIVALSGCLAAFGGWRFAKASAPVNGPIVLVSIDTLRADRVGAYGYAKGRTPAIDRLAREGILFERAYAHVPETLPSHVTMLTGQLPFESGVRDTAGFRISDDTRTIAELLRDRGYATGGVVSSFLLRKETGISRGFTFFDSERPAGATAAPLSLTRDGADSEAVAEHWLDSVGTPRAFLFLHIAEPHAPYTPHQRFKDLEPYDAAVAYADEIVGRLVQYLKAHQLYDRSTILLLSDHGEGLGDHGELEHGLLTYEESLRVPLLIKPPAGDASARRVAAPVQLADIVPTILDLAKAPGGSGLRGRSLTPFFNGGTIEPTDIYAESLFGQYRFGWAPLRSLIRGSHQLVTDGTTDQLFDLSVPPPARRDIADGHADLVSDLRTRLAQFTTKKPLAVPGLVTPGDRARYEALGYVGLPAANSSDTNDTFADPTARVSFVERFRAAVRLADGNEGQRAVDEFRELTREHPQMADLWIHLAQTAARNERQELAVEAYRHALTLTPADHAAALGAALSSVRLRRFDDAAQFAQEVLDSPASENVQKAEAHEVLARVALNRRDLAEARDEAAAAEAADPERPVGAFVEGRIAMDQGRYADAVTAFQQALDMSRTAGRVPLADLRVFAAESLLKIERPDDAEQLLEAELQAFPANARARAALQMLHRQAQQ